MKIFSLIFFSALFCISTFAQTVGFKHNVIYGARGILNVGLEIPTFTKQSLVFNVNYNPWKWGDNHKRKLFLFQPEYRYWFDDIRLGHFVGLQAHIGNYDYAKSTPFSTIIHHRYDGKLVGMGFTYGYQYLLSKHWTLEASISLGYARLNYKKYGPEKGDLLIDELKANYFGPTHLGLTFVYIIL